MRYEELINSKHCLPESFSQEFAHIQLGKGKKKEGISYNLHDMGVLLKH